MPGATTHPLRQKFDKRRFYFSGSPYGDFDNVIGEHNTYLQIDLSEYSKLTTSEKIEVKKAMVEIEFTSVKQIKEKFAEFVGLYKGVNTSGGGTGGTSNSSRPSSTINVMINPGEVVVTKDDTEKEIISNFSDVSNNYWAVDYINTLYERKIVHGDENKNFRPTDYITREEFVKCLVLALNIYDENAECDFIDVEKGAWYYPYVASAYKLGLVNGVSEDQFGVGNNIKRQDIALMIYRTGKITSDNKEVTFTDEKDISDYAKEAIKVMAGAGVISGNEGYFKPLKEATRAETAKMLCAVIEG